MDREGSEKEDSGSLYSPNYSQSLASVSVKRTECSIDKKRGKEGGGGGFPRKKPGNIFFDNLVPSRMAEMMERQCRVAVSFVRSFVRGKIRDRKRKRQKKEEGEKGERNPSFWYTRQSFWISNTIRNERRLLVKCIIVPSVLSLLPLSILDFLSGFRDSKTKIFQIISSKWQRSSAAHYSWILTLSLHGSDLYNSWHGWVPSQVFVTRNKTRKIGGKVEVNQRFSGNTANPWNSEDQRAIIIYDSKFIENWNIRAIFVPTHGDIIQIGENGKQEETGFV